MKITREFCRRDRHNYDFGLCSHECGWAQVDRAQDATDFETWANPTRLMVFKLSEGCTTLREAATPEELAVESREIDAWNRAPGFGPASAKVAAVMLRLDALFQTEPLSATDPCGQRRMRVAGHRNAELA